MSLPHQSTRRRKAAVFQLVHLLAIHAKRRGAGRDFPHQAGFASKTCKKAVRRIIALLSEKIKISAFSAHQFGAA
jgi:hypothetical protein